MKFAVPWMFLLFLPLLVAAWRLLRVGRKSGIRFSAVARLPSRAAGIRAQIAALTPFVLLAGLAMLVVAAARPRTPLAHETRSVDAIAIAMTVDVSGSMEALDLTPPGEKFSDKTTRLAIVKKLFAEFVERRPDDLIGLVTFGTYASTQSPLTADHPALLEVLKEVSIPQIEVDAQGRQIGDEGESRTAIGDGLATAVLA
ncbi:MAG: VWA domain-containing protein, partial [Kiritimatiellia bacterium]